MDSFKRINIKVQEELPSHQGLTNPLPGRPGQVLISTGQVYSIFMTPGQGNPQKITKTVSSASIYSIAFSAINRSDSKSW